MVIRVENVYKQFTRHKTIIEVLEGVHMQVAAGEMVAIVGPSGAGTCQRDDPLWGC
jgi:ABC-type lipoprotein export system ATPase subunit